MLKIKFFLLIIVAAAPTVANAQKAQAPANVNVINTPAVVVGNTPDNPVAVRQVGEQRQLFQVGGVVQFQCATGIAERSFEVPAGKRFIIESVAFRNLYSPDPGDSIRADITTTFEGVSRARPLDFRQQQFGQNQLFVATHPFLAYADGGTQITVHTFLSNPGDVFCGPSGTEVLLRGFITGYLIDAP